MPILGTYIDPEPLKQLLQDANEAGRTLEEHTALIIMAHLEREETRKLLSTHTRWQMIPTLDPFGKPRSLTHQGDQPMRLSINIDQETYERIQKEADKAERSIAAQVRLYVRQAYDHQFKANIILRERAACKQIMELTGTADTLETIRGPVVHDWGLVWHFFTPDNPYGKLRCVYGEPDRWETYYTEDPLSPPEATP